MLTNPAEKYRPFAPIHLPDRTWPSQTLTKPPIWLSTDLRDGNQALIDPMSVEQKLRLFEILVAIGFKEIEVAVPSASETDFRFVRRLIEEDRVPDDVEIQVLTQAREDLIRRTFESLQGAKRAIVHVYNATAPVFRRVVFRKDPAATIQLAVDAANLIRKLAAERLETQWRFQYSPEVFSQTENDLWDMPYLPIDPADLGRSYESVVRVNSQSGKGGIAFLLERDYNLSLPRRLQVEFSQVVQRAMDATDKEMTAPMLWELFEQEYLQTTAPFKYVSHHWQDDQSPAVVLTRLEYHGTPVSRQGCGNGPIDAFVNALNLGVRVHHYEERAIGHGSDADAIAMVEMAADWLDGTVHGVGIHSSIVTASLLAVLGAVNRGLVRLSPEQQQTIVAV